MVVFDFGYKYGVLCNPLFTDSNVTGSCMINNGSSSSNSVTASAVQVKYVHTVRMCFNLVNVCIGISEKA